PDLNAHRALVVGVGNAGLRVAESRQVTVGVDHAGIGRVAAEDDVVHTEVAHVRQDAVTVGARGAVEVGPADAVEAFARIPGGADAVGAGGAVGVVGAGVVAALVPRDGRRADAGVGGVGDAMAVGHGGAVGVGMAAVDRAACGAGVDRGGRAREAVVKGVVPEDAQQLGAGGRGA